MSLLQLGYSMWQRWRDFASGFKVPLSWFWVHRKEDYFGWAWPNQEHPLKDNLEVRASKQQRWDPAGLKRGTRCVVPACGQRQPLGAEFHSLAAMRSSVLPTTWMSVDEGCEPLNEIPARLVRPRTKNPAIVSLDSQPTETVGSYMAVICSC